MECALSAALQSEVPWRSPEHYGRILISPNLSGKAFLLSWRLTRSVYVCVCVSVHAHLLFASQQVNVSMWGKVWADLEMQSILVHRLTWIIYRCRWRSWEHFISRLQKMLMRVRSGQVKLNLGIHRWDMEKIRPVNVAVDVKDFIFCVCNIGL